MKKDLTISQKIQHIICSDFGQVVPINSENKKMIERYNKMCEENMSEKAFKNIIIGENLCGVLPGAHLEYLLNTDPNNKYFVTLRVSWWMDGFGGTDDSLIVMKPFSKILLGCTDSGTFPVTRFSRTIIEENKVIQLP